MILIWNKENKYDTVTRSFIPGQILRWPRWKAYLVDWTLLVLLVGILSLTWWLFEDSLIDYLTFAVYFGLFLCGYALGRLSKKRF